MPRPVHRDFSPLRLPGILVALAVITTGLAGCGSPSPNAGSGGSRTGGSIVATGGVQGGGGIQAGGSAGDVPPTGTGGLAGQITPRDAAASETGGARTGGQNISSGGTLPGSGGLATGGRLGTTGGITLGTGGQSSGGIIIGTGGLGTGGARSGGASITGGIVATTGGARSGGSGAGGIATAPGVLYNGIQWADTTGKPIQAHGGGILKEGGYYYWFGENRNPNGTFFAVSCYRSADLVHWEFRNHVLTQDSAAELKPANIERPKVVRNATTGKYVMWMHWENGTDYGAARAAVASGDTIDGDYTYHGSARPMVNGGITDHGKPGYMSRDCGLFVDTDGKAYFISASNENMDLNLYLLTADYLKIDSLVAVLFKGNQREAPVLWKRNGVYFLFTSGATGWNPNQAKYAASTSLASGWSAMTNIGDGNTFYSQSTYVIAVEGAAGTSYLYLGDRWAGAWSGPVNDSTYVAIPLTFPTNTTLAMAWNNTITIDPAAGALTAATNKFKFVNKASGKALAIEGASTADHGAAVQAAYTGGNEQKWSLNYDGAGYFHLTNVNSAKVLDVASGSTADGAAIIQWTNEANANQKWRVVDKGGGSYQLINKLSGKVAGIPVGSTAEGAPLEQRTNATGDHQLWQMAVAN